MGGIEKFLHEHFASLDDANENTTISHEHSDGGILPDFAPEALEPPFAKVNTVIDGSPAALAGLKTGDQIRSFGYVNYGNHDGLKKVGECVQGNEGVRPLFPVKNCTRLVFRPC